MLSEVLRLLAFTSASLVTFFTMASTSGSRLTPAADSASSRCRKATMLPWVEPRSKVDTSGPGEWLVRGLSSKRVIASSHLCSWSHRLKVELFQRFLTVFSALPGSSLAISLHLSSIRDSDLTTLCRERWYRLPKTLCPSSKMMSSLDSQSDFFMVGSK